MVEVSFVHQLVRVLGSVVVGGDSCFGEDALIDVNHFLTPRQRCLDLVPAVGTPFLILLLLVSASMLEAANRFSFDVVLLVEATQFHWRKHLIWEASMEEHASLL